MKLGRCVVGIKLQIVFKMQVEFEDGCDSGQYCYKHLRYTHLWRRGWCDLIAGGQARSQDFANGGGATSMDPSSA